MAEAQAGEAEPAAEPAFILGLLRQLLPEASAVAEPR